MKQLFTSILLMLFTLPIIASAATFIEYPDLEYGVTDSHVTELQKFLNTNNYIVNPVVGEPGSVGYEGTYFGKLTQKALSLFQTNNNITPAQGYFGKKTKAQMDIVLQSPEQADLSFSPLAPGTPGTQKYSVAYRVTGIPPNPAGCNNKSYTPTIVGTSNPLKFSYPVKMTFIGNVDDDLMINGNIVGATAGVSCSKKHAVSYSKEFPANTPITFTVIDQYGVDAGLSGEITIEPTSVQPPVSNVSLTTSAANGTIIQPNPSGIYTKGQSITVTAKPNPGYEFAYWSVACTGMKATCNLKMDANKSVTATFTKKQVAKVTLTIEGPGKILASISRKGGAPKPQEFTQTKTIEFQDFADLKLTAIANDGARVVGWTDERCKKTASTTIDVKNLTCKENPLFVASYIPGDANVTVKAKFEKVKSKAQCNVVAYGGYNSDGIFVQKVKQIVDTFNKDNPDVFLISNQFDRAPFAGKEALNDITEIRKSKKEQKILFAVHSISSIGLWNAIKDGNIKGDFSYLLYDPPYNSDKTAPDFWKKWFAWVPIIGDNPAAIQKACESGIQGSKNIINWTCGLDYDSYKKCKKYPDSATKKEIAKQMDLDHERYKQDQKVLNGIKSWLENNCK